MNNILIIVFILLPMIAPYRIMILFAIILFNKISLQGYKYFYWVVLIATLFYANLQSPNFVKSLLGHSQIGGGLIDFILISLLPLSLPVRPFKIGVLSLAIVLLCGYGGEHRQELANAFLAPGAFLFLLCNQFCFCYLLLLRVREQRLQW